MAFDIVHRPEFVDMIEHGAHAAGAGFKTIETARAD
jgi:hypothetical protein